MTARETPAAKPTVFIDNERVRVTEWRFAPGAATGWHRHEYDYVVVPMATASCPPSVTSFSRPSAIGTTT